MSSKTWLGAAVVAAVVSGFTSSAEAGVLRRRCAPTCATPACVTSCAAVCGHYEDVVVQRTVYVRETRMETRTINVTECRPEQRQRSFTVCRRVPYQETVTQAYTVMVQKTQMKRIVETVYKPVMHTVNQQYTVMVPHCEQRQGVQHVVQCYPVQETRAVCVDRGHWETREVQVPCGGYPVRCGGCAGYGYYGGSYGRGACGTCGGCGTCPPPTVTRCVRVWVPQIVQQQVAYTVMKQQLVARPYTYNVTVCKPETRVRQVQVCERVAEQVTRDVPVTICVPEQRTRTFNITRYKDVSENRVENYTVNVPHTVQKTIQVPVSQCVPKTVDYVVRKWVCGPAPTAVAPSTHREPATAQPLPPPAAPAPAPRNML